MSAILIAILFVFVVMAIVVFEWYMSSKAYESKFISDKATIATRKRICDGCRFRTPGRVWFIKLPFFDRCKPCGCFLRAKRKLKQMECPDGKW